jgi:shikimate kinase
MTSVVLVGLMGAGKSTVGALVGDKTDLTYVDVDRTIAGRTGRTVRQLWEEGGEAAYRQLESDVVLETLHRDDVVLAAPGGVVLNPVVRSVLEPAFVVWLRAEPATLAARVRDDDHRPLLGEHPLEVLTRMADARAELYRQVADVVIDTDHRDAGTVAGLIVGALGARRSCA